MCTVLFFLCDFLLRSKYSLRLSSQYSTVDFLSASLKLFDAVGKSQPRKKKNRKKNRKKKPKKKRNLPKRQNMAWFSPPGSNILPYALGTAAIVQLEKVRGMQKYKFFKSRTRHHTTLNGGIWTLEALRTEPMDLASHFEQNALFRFPITRL